jgi:hypothetical protein
MFQKTVKMCRLRNVFNCTPTCSFLLLLRSFWSYIGPFWAYCAYHRGLSRHIGPAIPTSAYLRAATLGANWVYWPIVAPTLSRPRGGVHHKLIMFLTWMASFTYSCIDTRYTEPRFTVQFDGRKEPRRISPMWPGIKPGTCRLLGRSDNR